MLRRVVFAIFTTCLIVLSFYLPNRVVFAHEVLVPTLEDNCLLQNVGRRNLKHLNDEFPGSKIQTHHKAELVVEGGVEVVLHDFGLELVVGAGHEEDPDIGVHLAWKGL